MRSVVIVGPDFSPSSLPPALRIRFFAKHLREHGWEPTVVSVDPRFYESAVDPENERLVPPGLRVVRTKALPARVTRAIGIGDIGMRSLWQQWRAVAEICRAGGADAILIPIPPYVSAVIGRLAYERFGVPYVVDYIDPWISDDWRRRPRAQRLPKRALADRLSRLLEPFALRRVGHVTGVSKGTTDGVVARYAWLRQSDATEIPYGAEPDDFAYLREHPRRNAVFDRNDGLVHVSSVGRGGWDLVPALRRVFNALKLGLQRSPQSFARLRLHFVGTSYAPFAAEEQVIPVARECGVADLVDERPARVPYLDALQILLDSHGLLAIGSDMPHYTASKIFPYILARRPMLAVFHAASSVNAIMRETGAGAVAVFDGDDSPESGAPEIGAWLTRLLSGAVEAPSLANGAFAAYTASAMTKRLADVLDEVASRAEGARAR